MIIRCAISIFMMSGYFAAAQDIVAIENGYLTFESDPEDAFYYSIEFSPDLHWWYAASDWIDIRAWTEEMTVPLGLFYRVTGSPYPLPKEVFKTGQIHSYAPLDDGWIRPGAFPPYPRFFKHEDDTVKDLLTGLIWLRDANPSGFFTWADAITFCNESSFAEFTDWRLPSRFELESLLDLGQSRPSLPEDHPFTNMPDNASYWSSTTFAGDTDAAWWVGMGDGQVNAGGKATGKYAWPVRGRYRPVTPD